MQKLLVAMQIIFSIAIIVSVMMQPSKADGFNNFAAPSQDTFYAKHNIRTSEKVLARITVISSILFAIVTIAINIIK
ncbi:preprotein translocase subunit SecG [Clostridium sp. KNHs214]|uniref:preprotein translocase subunit SecG n=1 Tax=Clostridium sp. KNHs214 TaxID=1540257 RepID=UPI000553D595|nr:preprotein translocase subunit SecG [Clostridium sp. KNHs214]